MIGVLRMRVVGCLVLVAAALFAPAAFAADPVRPTSPMTPSQSDETNNPGSKKPIAAPPQGNADQVLPTKDQYEEWLSRIDTDGDGQVTREEWAAHQAAGFNRVDADHDGKLTMAEMHAALKPQRESEAAKVFQRWDSNKDGFVTREEFLGRDFPGFKMLDTDGDGNITADELRNRRAATKPRE
jgi:Ca2+-binding EF-hand superfamily protein